jgi:1-acyl-sn-glycerol-3-phosphate acyltransferase
MAFLKKDAFGNYLLIKRWIIIVFGSITHYRFTMANQTVVSGAEHLKGLPDRRVLFVSNHQTYFADVAAMYHIFNHAKWNRYSGIDTYWPVLFPRLNVYFIAAVETMKKGILPRLFAYVGSVSIKRTWRAAGKNVDRNVDPRDVKKITTAIENGWVITFPQGTTKPFMPGRRGTAKIIKDYEPIVIPVVVEGFRRAFNKRGLLMKKRGCTLRVRIKPPIAYDPGEEARLIMDRIMESIEQSERHYTPKRLVETRSL